jgi:hypothetical protein
MTRKTERSVQELYRDDPERADALAFGRRGALKGAALAAMGGAVGAAIPFGGNMPPGTLPALFARPAAAQGAAAAASGPQMMPSRPTTRSSSATTGSFPLSRRTRMAGRSPWMAR